MPFSLERFEAVWRLRDEALASRGSVERIIRMRGSSGSIIDRRKLLLLGAGALGVAAFPVSALSAERLSVVATTSMIADAGASGGR